jgi:hypothetical protein
VGGDWPNLEQNGEKLFDKLSILGCYTVSCLGGLLDPEHGSNTIVRNIGNYLATNTA